MLPQGALLGWKNIIRGNPPEDRARRIPKWTTVGWVVGEVWTEPVKSSVWSNYVDKFATQLHLLNCITLRCDTTKHKPLFGFPPAANGEEETAAFPMLGLFGKIPQKACLVYFLSPIWGLNLLASVEGHLLWFSIFWQLHWFTERIRDAKGSDLRFLGPPSRRASDAAAPFQLPLCWLNAPICQPHGLVSFLFSSFSGWFLPPFSWGSSVCSPGQAHPHGSSGLRKLLTPRMGVSLSSSHSEQSWSRVHAQQMFVEWIQAGGSSGLVSEGWIRAPQVEGEPQVSQAEGAATGWSMAEKPRVSRAEGSMATVLSGGHSPLAAPVWSVVCSVWLLTSCDPELLLYFLSEAS